MHFSQKPLMRYCSKISWIAIVLYFLDIILLGTGQLTKIGPFSTRILFFAVAVLAALPFLFVKIREYVRNPFLLAVGAFMIWLCIAFVIGVVNGNRLDIIKSDIFGYANLLLLPAMLYAFTDKKHIFLLMKIIVAATFIVAIAAIVLSFYAYFPNQLSVYRFTGESGLCSITEMGQNATRIYFHTGSRYCLVAYMISFYFFLTGDSKRKYIWLLPMAIFIVAIFISYSRAQYLGSVLAVVLSLIMILWKKRSFMKQAIAGSACAVILACAILGTLSLVQHTNLFKVGIYRVLLSVSIEEEPGGKPIEETPSDDYLNLEAEMNSLNIRNEKIAQLQASISKNWLFGNGLGAAIQEDNGYVEYTYYDIMNKMGLVGLLLFVAPFGLIAFFTCRRKQNQETDSDAILQYISLSSIFYFMVITYFNPCMNTTVGISCYVFAMAVANVFRKKEMPI